MEKPVPVTKKSVPEFAKFFAQYIYLQRYHALGFAFKSSFRLGDGDYTANLHEDKIVIRCQYDVSVGMVRQDTVKRLHQELAQLERQEAHTRDALSKLEASIKQVDGKRSMLAKIDKEKQPEMYATESKKLVELESFLGDYQPFLDEYNATIQRCQLEVEEVKKAFENLPVLRDSQEWTFTIDEIAKIAQ